MFAAWGHLLFGVFLPRKNSHKFSLYAFWNVSAKSFKSSCEKVKCLKNFYYIWTFSQVIFKVSITNVSPIYLSTYLQESVVSYIVHTLCIRIHICKRCYFPFLLVLRWKAKFLVFGLHFLLDLINLFNILLLLNKFF